MLLSLSCLTLLATSRVASAQGACNGPFTATVAAHVTAGRAVARSYTDCSACRFGCYWPFFCAKRVTTYAAAGSMQDLGTNSQAVVTLYEDTSHGSGYFTTTSCQAVCGNGAVETGEGCDPAAPGWNNWSCDSATCQPSSISDTAFTQTCTSSGDCSSDEACLKSGDSWLCMSLCGNPSSQCPAPPTGYTLQCLYPICFPRCDNGEPCPPGMDCNEVSGICQAPPVCGNGIVEAGEGCDPTATGWSTWTCDATSCQPSGVSDSAYAKACTSSSDCPSGEACLKSGDSWICMSLCDNSDYQCPDTPTGYTLDCLYPICLPSCRNNGWCPPGMECNSAKLCQYPPVCGNGVIESGEGCDPAVFGWDTWSCDSQTCQPSSISDTAYTKLCETAGDCSSGEACIKWGGAKVCTSVCDANSQCPAPPTGYSLECTYPFCFAQCGNGEPCPPGLDCNDLSGLCQALPVCGNGIVEGGEGCDPTAPGWSTWTCDAVTCQPSGVSSTAYTKRCTSASDCPSGEACLKLGNELVCMSLCDNPSFQCPDTPTGHTLECLYPICFPRCTNNGWCPPGLTCDANSFCVAP